MRIFPLQSSLTIISALTFAISAYATAPTTEEITSAVQQIESSIPPINIPSRTIDLAVWSGLRPDTEGKVDFREKAQTALDELSKSGGGTLHFTHPLGAEKWIKPFAVYRMRGPLELHSNTRLLLDHSVRIYFEYKPEAYTNGGKGVITRFEGTTVYSYSPLIRAFNCSNIVIEAATSNGAMPEIVGDGERWVHEPELIAKNKPSPEKAKKPDSAVITGIRAANDQDIPLKERHSDYPGTYFYTRPDLIQFFLCENVRVEGVKLCDSPFWVVHPIFSKNLVFRRLLFDCQNVNNDGIDPESSRNVIIEDIIFNNHDDNIALKAGRNLEGRKGVLIEGTELQSQKSEYIQDGRLGGESRDVVIRNCVFKGHYALCIGSEMSGGVRNIYALDNIAPQDINMGVFIKGSRARGGVVQNIVVRNLRANIIKSEAIAILPNYDGDKTSPYPSLFKDISISGVSARQVGQGIKIYGWPDQLADNISIENIDLVTAATSKTNLVNFGCTTRLSLKNVKINGQSFDGNYPKTDLITPEWHD